MSRVAMVERAGRLVVGADIPVTLRQVAIS